MDIVTLTLAKKYTEKIIKESIKEIEKLAQELEEYAENIKHIKIVTDEEVIDVLIETDVLAAVKDSDGSILADENDNILMW